MGVGSGVTEEIGVAVGSQNGTNFGDDVDDKSEAVKPRPTQRIGAM